MVSASPYRRIAHVAIDHPIGHRFGRRRPRLGGAPRRRWASAQLEGVEEERELAPQIRRLAVPLAQLLRRQRWMDQRGRRRADAERALVLLPLNIITVCSATLSDAIETFRYGAGLAVRSAK